MLPNQFLELLYRYTSRPITSFLHRRAESPCEDSSVSAWSSAPERPRFIELSRAGSGLTTRLVSGAEVRTREGRVEDETARTQAPSPTSSSARRRRRRPAGARSRDGLIVVKSRGYKIRYLGNKPSPAGVDPHTPSYATDRRAPPQPVGTNARLSVATAAPPAPSPARTPASAAPRPSRAVPPRSARAAVLPIVSAPAPSPAGASRDPPPR